MRDHDHDYDYDYDLGGHGRRVTTSSPAAQTWFDRGLTWTYAFHHEEAVRCFEAAAAADPGCAMAEWGLAYALGPNYNKPWEFFDAQELRRTAERAHGAVRRARAKAAGATAVEQALIDALQARYPRATAPDAGEVPVWNAAYADRMRAVHRLAGDDPDVAALYADALMNLTPGSCGTSAPAGQPRAPAPWRPRPSSSRRSPPGRARGTRDCCTCTST